MLDGPHHGSEKLTVQGGLIHKSRYMGFWHHNHMDLCYGSRVMERQYQVVFMHTHHVKLS